MKRQRRLHLFLLLVIITAYSVFDLTAGTVSSFDGFVVNMPARTLPNGIVQPAHTHFMTRPAANTILPGVVYVMTKKSFGMVKGERTLANSSVNLELQDLRVHDVSLAMLASKSADVRSPEAVASGLDRLYVIKYSEALDPFDLCKRLMSNPDVEYAVPARTHQISFTPNDTRYSQQTFLSKIRVPQAWDVTKGSSSILIAIIDTGTDWMHEDLAANIYTNPGELAGNGIDDDNNGYIDDVRGWDFVGNVSAFDLQNGDLHPDNDPRQQGNSWTDGQAHGTVVAGNAAAVTNNAKGVAGIASNCKILPIKCGADDPNILQQGGIIQGYPAIQYAADMGADVINCSWGGYGTDPSAQTFIDYAISKGAIVVAAAGNNGVNLNANPHAPGCLDGVLGVGSVNGNDVPSYFSNYGYANTTYAPGENPLSTFPGNQYRGLSGTSFSSPVVAGVVALVRSVHPDWTPQQVLMQIRMTNDPVSGISAANKPLYFGRINAERAVKVNTTWTGGERLPGVGLSSFSVDGSDRITTFDETTIRLNFKNVLADAQGVVVNAQIADSYIELLTAPEIVLGDMTQNATQSGIMKIKLKPNYPWYKGTVNVGLTIRTATTSNFAFVSIPVELQSTNALTSPGPREGIVYSRATITSDENVWGTGDLGGGNGFIIKGKDAATSSFNYLQMVPTALNALNADVGMIGGLRGGVATIQTTTSGGAGWSTTAVNSFAKTVDAIEMFDASNAICIGTGSGAKFGIGKTTNGGSTWTHIGSSPLMSGSESVVPRTAYVHNDYIWFGTTSGRVVRSTDKGLSWSVTASTLGSGVIESIAFSDSLRGVMLYRTDAAAGSPKRIASSTDGGRSWTKNVFDPSTLGITASFVSSPGSHVVLVGSNGEVFASDNAGANWQVILSQPSGNVVMGQGIRFQTQNALLLAGSQLGVLTYRYSGPNSSRILAFETPTTDFGTIDVGKNKLKYIKVNNTGEGDARIESVNIVSDPGTPTGAFAITIALSPVILAHDDDQFGVRCTASDTGTYGATIYVISNATPDTIKMRLTAHITGTVSVDDNITSGNSIGVWPNPAHDILNIATSTSINSITIVDARGLTVATLFVDKTQSVQRVNIANLAAGIYRVIADSENGVQSIPFSVIR